MKNRAFTLIELLVVIAIIAILAAILFPVFAQAKAAAKKAASLSNTKQLGTAAYTYMSDVDDTMPIFFTRITGGICIPNDQTQCGYRSMWQNHLHPYMKNWQIYTAPGDTNTTNSVTAYYNTSYGYNYGYLSNLCVPNDALSAAYGCSATDPGAPTAASWFQGISATSVTRPANIIMFGDNGGKSINGATVVGSIINAPDAWPANKYFYGPVQVGWGPNCQNYFHESAGGAGWSNGKYKNWDGFAPRYSDGGNVVFVDSHAKFFKPGNLVAGTNSNNLTTACTNLLVTDYANYMWDPRYDSGPQR